MQDDYEKRVKDALDGRRPDAMTINSAISRSDFDRARSLIEMLPEGAQRNQLTETANLRESNALAVQGDLAGAMSLAGRLNRATSILAVYPNIIGKCAAKQDETCAAHATYQAMRQLWHADTTPPTPPAGVPVSMLPSGREFDPTLLGLSRLAKSITPVNETLALEVLDEMIATANRSDIDTGQGRTGFEADVFKTVAEKNEPRARQAAAALKDQLCQIVALAAVYQAKAEELTKGDAKAARQAAPR
ncbi:MAG: hypothetical protein ACRD68_08540 [Pyrinomonadaceae bacterium]